MYFVIRLVTIISCYYLHSRAFAFPHNIENIKDERVVKTTKSTTDTKYVTWSNSRQVEWNSIQKDLYDILSSHENQNSRICFMDALKRKLIWWAHCNGTLAIRNLFFFHDSYLDYSFRNQTNEVNFYIEVYWWMKEKEQGIYAFSAANNLLEKAPFRTLSLMRRSLIYLTLKGNHFINCDKNGSTEKSKGMSVAWATFPRLPTLSELDISNCQIEFIHKDAFKYMTNLNRLYMSHNKIMNIPVDAFCHVPLITVLDISHMNRNMSGHFNVVLGKSLPNLEYLDLSHTKLSDKSKLRSKNKLKFLSLCYTGLDMVLKNFFISTSLVGLDLSGNAFIGYRLIDELFNETGGSLKYLFFERANLKDIDWIKNLKNIKILGLSGNNINSVSLDLYSSLAELQVLDLSSNHVTNWYSTIFVYNAKLTVLNLRDNSINILTAEMLKDFQNLEYLGIGHNNFVCDCVLGDFFAIAAANNKKPECAHELVLNKNINATNKEFEINSSREIGQLPDFEPDMLYFLMPKLLSSYINIKAAKKRHQLYNMQFFDRSNSNESAPISCGKSEINFIYDYKRGSPIKLQLLDYDNKHYWCFNQSVRLDLNNLKCASRLYNPSISGGEIDKLKNLVQGIVSMIVITLILGIFIYHKRWHIHYYFTSLKTAALVSLAAKDTVDQYNQMCELNPHLVYDVFISFCQSDRKWVLEELLPNIEVADDISVCMHERDFQVGLTILDNIVSCMDRSRLLMLIISSDFLLSHWCQFEMHLAQHRMFETCKEHLILILLEDIPRWKRPKTLQYLMEVKTYIKWPSSVKLEEKNVFWKRLRRSLGIKDEKYL